MDARPLDLFEHVALQASRIPESFTKPDDDWTPVMFMQTDESDDLSIIPLEPYMGNDREKDILAEVLMPAAIKHLKATKVVMVLSVWAAEVASPEELEPIRYVPPSQRDNRREMVMIVEYTSDGVTRTASAEIERHEGAPPTLGDWDDMDGAKLGDGRMITPIVKALKEVRKNG